MRNSRSVWVALDGSGKVFFDAICVIPARFGLLASEMHFDAICVIPARFGLRWMASEKHFWRYLSNPHPVWLALKGFGNAFLMLFA